MKIRGLVGVAGAGRSAVSPPCPPVEVAPRSGASLTACAAADALRRPGSTTLLGASTTIASARDDLRRFARYQHPVLVRGESGTGKELAARILHEHSGRSGPLVALNCGATSESLVRSQLFGHVRGAFTGAESEHRGAFVRAHGGTLFLDEVGELPLPSQAVLLRVLETAHVCPVGSEQSVHVDTRLVCATHRDLEQMVGRGTFRQDLFHRLCVFAVEMPALRHRPEDIEPLLHHFAKQAAGEVGHAIEFTPGAREAARTFAWPGNVRQLRNAVLRAAVLSQGHPLDAATLIPSVTTPRSQDIAVPRGDYRAMRRALLETVVRESGSIRKASTVLGVPRSTLGNWLRQS